MIHVLVAICVAFSGLMADERSSAPKQSMLSDVLPEALAAFVVTFGHDRPLDSTLQADATKLSSAVKMIDSDLAVGLLSPPLVTELDERALFKSVAADGQRAADADLVLIAGTPVLLDSGRVLVPGEQVPAGETVRFGLVLNGGKLPAEAIGPGRAIHLIVKPGDGVLFPCSDTCSITCSADGTYACAHFESVFECAKCECVDNTELDGRCVAGGMGASGCSVKR